MQYKVLLKTKIFIEYKNLMQEYGASTLGYFICIE